MAALALGTWFVAAKIGDKHEQFLAMYRVSEIYDNHVSDQFSVLEDEMFAVGPAAFQDSLPLAGVLADTAFTRCWKTQQEFRWLRLQQHSDRILVWCPEAHYAVDGQNVHAGMVTDFSSRQVEWVIIAAPFDPVRLETMALLRTPATWRFIHSANR